MFGLGLLLTSGSLALLHALHPAPQRGPELAVLVSANLTATVLRFVLLRGWVFRSGRRQDEPGGSEPAGSAFAEPTVPSP